VTNRSVLKAIELSVVWSKICLHHEQIMLKICMLELLMLLDYRTILLFAPSSICFS